MGTSVVPELMRAMFETYTEELADYQVNVGTGLTEDPRDYVMIGVDDIDGVDWANAADAAQEFATVGQDHSRDETGTISCAALVRIGDTDMLAAIEELFKITAAIEEIHRTNYALGVEGVMWTSFGGNATTRLLETPDGSYALLVFQIGFRARI